MWCRCPLPVPCLLLFGGLGGIASSVPRSHLRLVIAMVDNESGLVTWYSDREFAGVDPTDPAKVRGAVEKSLRRLPRPGAG